MKTYYSLVSISTNPSFDEKFNIGLICVTPKEIFYHFSKSKFKVISKLLSSNGRKLALSGLQAIEKNLNPIVSEFNRQLESKTESKFSESYFNYLSKYNNNLIQFSQAESIDLDVDKEVFNVLFKKYIYDSELFEEQINSKTTSFNSRKNNFKQSVKEFANINFSVSNAIIKDLVVPVTVDVFGKNGAFVSNQIIDFTRPIETLKSEISSYLYLVEQTAKADVLSQNFLLGEEPLFENTQQHDIWNEIRKFNLIEFVPFNESQRIINYMIEKGVEPIVK
ncbi:MAG: hypothetical protein FGM14_02410 [Flavobacteriales bacterium]|nr:hypothetical protein [Flavobacteriales bacterium]